VVDDDDIAAALRQDTVQDFTRQVFAFRHPEAADFRVVVEDGRRPVGRVVVAGKHFEVAPVLREDSGQRAADSFFVVAGRNHDADHLRLCRFPCCLSVPSGNIHPPSVFFNAGASIAGRNLRNPHEI